MTRFARRATVAAVLIAAPMFTIAAPAAAGGTASGTTTSAAGTNTAAGDYPNPYRHRPWKRPRPRPTTSMPAPTRPPVTTSPTTPAPTRPPVTTSPSPTRPPVTTAPTVPATSPATTPTSAPVPPSDHEAQVITLTNAQRATAGCGPLRTDSRLIVAARAHSNDMVAQKFFSHTGSNGSTFVDRLAQAGYTTGASAENIAWGYRTPDEVVTGWMNSAGHRANILDCKSIAVGVGLALSADGTAHWTQNFGRI